MQRLAPKGDFLAALIRAQGRPLDAARNLGLDEDISHTWRMEDPLYAKAEDAIITWIASNRPPTGRRKTPDEELDKAAALIECGTTIEAASSAIGITSAGLWKASKRHERLRGALVARSPRGPFPKRPRPRRGAPSKLTQGKERELRNLWASNTPVRIIAARLEVSDTTVQAWRKKLDLPNRGT
ncbi:hypothetical protein [Streptomyces triculaminicus]|uniref:hypothetical protein n=1 Tax=Streptomyces triculaminicus TaxID=2816232 RepID=UPI00378D62A6